MVLPREYVERVVVKNYLIQFCTAHCSMINRFTKLLVSLLEHLLTLLIA